MLKIGLIREEKIPADNRVAFTPEQCKWIRENKNIMVFVQPSETRCYKDGDYKSAGLEVQEDLSDCSVLFGIKEVPVAMLIPNKTYFFFSHTKKLQVNNQKLLQAIIRKKITLVDYECLLHEDGARLLGFGFFAGVVGAHNGMLAYGKRTGKFTLERVFELGNFEDLIHSYFKLKVPPVRIVVTGSGRVSNGIVEVMSLMGIKEVEPQDYQSSKKYTYPIYVHLKGGDLYQNRKTGKYEREEFHNYPEKYDCLFKNYVSNTDILMNGVYWDIDIPRLFELEDLKKESFKLQVIADISDDRHGSIPCNIGDATIENPVYGIDKLTGNKTAPYLPGSLDLMAVGNLPNELPKDASKYFGEQLNKYIIDDLDVASSAFIKNATIIKDGHLTSNFDYMKEYAGLSE